MTEPDKGRQMATKRQTVRLKKSKVENLYRHVNGRYYARAMVAGKAKERSLGTDDYNVAAAKLPQVLQEMRGATREHKAGTLGEAIRAEIARQDPDIKPRTQEYYREVGEHVLVNLGKLADKPLPKVTTADLRGWREGYAGIVGVTRHNGALSFLRRVWSRAVEARHVGSNPAAELRYLKPEERDWRPPSKEEFQLLIDDIVGQRKRSSLATAWAIELLAYTGMRISEAQDLRWKDIKNGSIIRRARKGGRIISAPLIPAAEDLLQRMKGHGVPHGANDPVLLVKSPRIALANACKRLDLDHIRVHDLRHIFATRCLESGVDFPTLAGWLGHKDGGILAAKTYGHLVPAHSEKQAKNVSF